MVKNIFTLSKAIHPQPIGMMTGLKSFPMARYQADDKRGFPFRQNPSGKRGAHEDFPPVPRRRADGTRGTEVVRKYGAKAYDFRTSTITVTIPFDRRGFEKEDVPVNVPVKQTDEDKIVEAIKMDSHVTMDEMARIIGKIRKTLL